MKQFFAVLFVLALLAPVSGIAGDRARVPCFASESSLCAGLVNLYEFEETLDYDRTSETSGLSFLEPDATDVPRSGTYKTCGPLSTSPTCYSLDLDETTVYIPHLGGFSGQFTLSFWIYLNDAPTTGSVFLAPVDVNSNIGYTKLEFVVSGSDNFVKASVIESSLDTVYTVTSTTDLNVSTWYMVTVGVNNSLSTDGHPFMQSLWITTNAADNEDEECTNLPIYSSTGDLKLGYVDGTKHNDFLIDQLGFWVGALTEAEIDELYNSGSGKAYPFVN
jgi:hypothetical protein